MKPRPTPASLVAQLIAAHRDPVSRLRAGGVFGRNPPALELYYEPGDPHSHLCAQVLSSLIDRVEVPIVVRLVGESAPEDYPERDRQRAYALTDAARIAPAYGMTFPAGASVPDAAAREWAAEQLAVANTASEFVRAEPAVAEILFAGRAPAPRGDAGVRRLLADNAGRRKRLGHNLPAVWQYAGDWFWGVDRLEYLAARLRHDGRLHGDAPLAERRPGAALLPALPEPVPPLEFFFSFRSPYSYLGAVRMRSFHTEWPGGVAVRPVLPMAMRNLSVPRVKRLYTLRDAKREADRLGIPFGRAADPLGDGARRCLAVFPLASSTEQQLDLLVSAGRAIWSEGVDVAGDPGLRYVCERAGIDWGVAQERIDAATALDYAEENRRDLLAAGLWGVPCYRSGEFSAWGQDRFWMLRDLVRRPRNGQRR